MSDEMEALVDRLTEITEARRLGFQEAVALDVELARKRGCVCFSLEAAADFNGYIEEQEDDTGEQGSLYQVVVHDPRCPIAMADEIEKRGK